MTALRQSPFAHIFEDAPQYIRAEGQHCEHPHCTEEGIHRAPKDRQGDVLWFCLQHVREYNAKWNYYHDVVDDAGIEACIRRNITWERPSWPLHQGHTRDVHDPFDLEELRRQARAKKQSQAIKKTLSSAQADALALFNLGYPYVLGELKKRYRQLVKEYHPDTHNNDPHYVEMIQKINQAYQLLKKAL